MAWGTPWGSSCNGARPAAYPLGIADTELRLAVDHPSGGGGLFVWLVRRVWGGGSKTNPVGPVLRMSQGWWWMRR